MDKFKKSKILMLLLLTALIFIIPFLSSSFRTTYLCFIINLLILVLGAEAGLLSSSSKPPEEKKPGVSDTISSKTVKPTCPVSTKDDYKQEDAEKAKTMRKSVSAKANYSVGIVKLNDKVNKSASTPSIFFVGGEEKEQQEEEDAAVADFPAVNDEEAEGPSGQELFTKAENFIGNFYKQLKMQREESWKRIHGVYQKAF